MSLIKNLITEKETQTKSKGRNDLQKEANAEYRPVIKSATDLQRLKLNKLMKNPEKPIVLPMQRKEKDYMQMVPTFVRNVMGSSAGAGSGEFHVYRHLRRKEYARQKTIQAKSTKEKLDDEFRLKLEENRSKAEDKTAKKRAKRLKKKERSKRSRQQLMNTKLPQTKCVSESESGEDDSDTLKE